MTLYCKKHCVDLESLSSDELGVYKHKTNILVSIMNCLNIKHCVGVGTLGVLQPTVPIKLAACYQCSYV